MESPHVQRAYLANVPRNMDEAAFWQRYYKHQYMQEVCSATV